MRDRAFAWIDDDIGTDCHVWARERGTPTLLLDIHSGHGLTEPDVERLLAFAAEVNGRG